MFASVTLRFQTEAGVGKQDFWRSFEQNRDQKPLSEADSFSPERANQYERQFREEFARKLERHINEEIDRAEAEGSDLLRPRKGYIRISGIKIRLVTVHYGSIKAILDIIGVDKGTSTFAAKITMAYALELIGPISRADLNLIRFLRNSFAHSRKPMNFEVPEVRAVCAKLQFPDLAQITVPWGPMHRLPEPEESDKDHPRTRYRPTCHNLTTRFIVMTSPSLSGELASTDLLPSNLLP
jgi:hypothetical protein